MTLSKNSNFPDAGGVVHRAASLWSTNLDAKVTPSLRVVAVSGGLQSPSKSAGLAQHLLDLIADQVPCLPHMVDLGLLAPQLTGAVWRTQVPDAVEQALAVVEQADVLVVATPVFRGSYTGLFKHFFDLIGQDALIDKPVLLAATGGSDRHALVIDHQFRPLFSFFQAHTLPIGVYGSEAEIQDYQITSPALQARIDLAAERARPFLRPRSPAVTSVHKNARAAA